MIISEVHYKVIFFLRKCQLQYLTNFQTLNTTYCPIIWPGCVLYWQLLAWLSNFQISNTNAVQRCQKHFFRQFNRVHEITENTDKSVFQLGNVHLRYNVDHILFKELNGNVSYFSKYAINK